MTHMFNISDSESEASDDIVIDDQSKENDSGIKQLEPAIERLRIHSDSLASTSSLGEDGELPEGATFEEGEEPGEGLRKRGRSMSAPPQLWAAKKYGRQLRRMSDEFDTILDSKARKRAIEGSRREMGKADGEGAMKELQKGRASKMRTSFSWFAFWRGKDSDNELNSNSGSGVDRCAE